MVANAIVARASIPRDHRDRLFPDSVSAVGVSVSEPSRWSGSRRVLSRPATSRATDPRTSSWGVNASPPPTARAPIPAPVNAPMLQPPCKPDIRGRPLRRSMAMAWVFIATSRVPWNTPHRTSAPNSAGRLPVMPTSGPAAQYPHSATWMMRRLPKRGNNIAARHIAAIDPTGAPTSARPKAPSFRPSDCLTCGMCAVHDANNRPWTTKTTVIAIRVAAARGEASCVASGLLPRSLTGLDTMHDRPRRLERRDGLSGSGVVGDDDVHAGCLAHHGHGRMGELRSVEHQDGATSAADQGLFHRGVAEVVCGHLTFR